MCELRVGGGSQINFWDHQKLLLTEQATKITLIEPDLNLKTYYIGELFREAYDYGLFKAKDKVKTEDEDEGKSKEWIAKRDKIAFVLSKLECEFFLKKQQLVYSDDQTCRRC